LIESAHTPVLLNEVVDNVVNADDRIFVDATVGGGGHGYQVLETYRNLRLIGIDADEDALARAGERLQPFKERVILKRGNFSDLKAILKNISVEKADAVLFDLGISMYQMSGERGFSFNDTESLDMRIDRHRSLTAYEVVNMYDFTKLSRIIREYGDEGDAPRIAKAIVDARKKKPFTNAKELGDLVANAKKGRGKIHPATKTFQAIRMEVNKERENLNKGLEEAIDVVREGGRIGVITFHSIEDRFVKNFFKNHVSLGVVTKKAIKPGRDEVLRNRKSRSAKLRVAERI
jgi:16S rRNA (cytosine1402-N4)-methyltransferase